MCAQELATAAQYKAPVIILVVNNGIYGTIRMHQEKHYPGRVIGTDIVNPEFAVFARAFGCVGEIVTETAQFAPALARAMASGKPAVIESFGLAGFGYHSSDEEYVELDSIEPRLYLLARMIVDAARGR